MGIVLDTLLGAYRATILLFGILLSLMLGNAIVSWVNTILRSVSFPCLQIVSYLVIFVVPVAIFYGVAVQKYFWKRLNSLNWKIFIASYLVGLIFTTAPFEKQGIPVIPGNNCASADSFPAIGAHLFGTGLFASLFAFGGVDLGVFLKDTSKKIWVTGHKTKPAKRRRR